MSLSEEQLLENKKDDIVKEYLNDIQKKNNNKNYVSVSRDSNGNRIFYDNINNIPGTDTKKLTKQEFEELFQQIQEAEEKKETNPKVTQTMRRIAAEIDDQMQKITNLRKETDRLEAKLEIPLNENEEKNKEIISQIKEKNTEIANLRDKLIDNISSLRKYNPNPLEEKPTTETGRLIQDYNLKLQKFINQLSTPAKITDEQLMDVFHVALEEPQIVGQYSTPQTKDQGIPQTIEIEEIPQPDQIAKTYPDMRTLEIDKIISEIDKLAEQLNKLATDESKDAKLLHEHATNQGEKLTESELYSTLDNANKSYGLMIETTKLIDAHLKDLEERYSISGIEWDQLTKDKQNIKSLKFDEKGLTAIPSDPYSKEAKSLKLEYEKRYDSFKEIGNIINEESLKLKQLLQDEHIYFEELKKTDKAHNTIDNYVDLERKHQELNTKIIETQRKLNEQIQLLNNNKILKEEWDLRGQVIQDENLNLFQIKYDETNNKVKESTIPKRDDFGPLLENLKQKNTQKQAKSNISDPNQSNTVTATQEERKWLRAMREATIESLKSSGIDTNPINPIPSWKDKNYTISDTKQKVDIKLTTNSVETKNPTNSNLKAMSAAIAANVLARISKDPPESPKVTLGDCKPPEVAREFAKQIELALTNLKTQHPNYNDKINTILENFKTNHSEPLKKAVVTLQNDENKPPKLNTSTQTGQKFTSHM